jgi:hypothetical protein
MQEQDGSGAHQGAADIDIADFEDVVALAFALTVAGVVAAADETRTMEDLVGRVVNGGSQAGDLNDTQTLELCPGLVRRLGEEFA